MIVIVLILIILYNISVSEYESIKSLSVSVFISDKAITTFFSSRLSFNGQQMLKILEQSHLLRVVFRVVLNVLLMSFEVLDNVFLLSKFGTEEFTVTFELVCESLIRLCQKLRLI